MKKTISILLSIVMTFTFVCSTITTSAEESAQSGAYMPSIENDISVTGTNSFGNMISYELSEEMDKQEENNGCNVFSAEVTGKTVSVEYETTEDCTLLAAVYDEEGTQLLASGTTEVTHEETTAAVEIETSSMPEYFYLKVYLVDNCTLKPLCNVYNNPNYTKEMQEFLAKTVDDFDSDRVMNLDSDKTNNFAVFSEDTKVIEHSGNINQVAAADEDNEYYVIKNADSTVKSLKKDDIFTYEYDDGTMLIVKVDTISVSGTTATITGQNTDMEEVFEYVKIDSAKDEPSAQSETPKTYNPYSAYLPAGPEILALEGELKASVTKKSTFVDKTLVGSDDNNVKINGSVEFTLSGSVKYYISWTYSYLELKLDYNAKIGVEVSANAKGTLPLSFIGISPIPGVIIEMTPSLIVEVSAKVSVDATLSGTVGIGCDSETGKKSLTTTPSLSAKVKFDGTIFLGVSFEPKVKIINDKIAKASLTAKLGGEIKGTMSASTSSSSDRHECQACINGDIFGKFSLNASVTLGNKKEESKKAKWSFKLDLINVTVKLFDWYYSVDHDEIGFGTCPYLTHKVTVQVKDPDGNDVSGAAVDYYTTHERIGTTDENGKLEVWLKSGDYDLWVTKNVGNLSGRKEFDVDEKAKTIVVTINDKNNFNGNFIETPDIYSPNSSNKPNCTSNNYWVVFYEGFRNKRLEMSTFDSIGETYIVWNTSLKAMNQDGKCNQYYFDDNNEWKKIGTYSILTDYAVDIVASNVDIYNSNHELIYGKSDYNNYDFAEYRNYNSSKDTSSLNKGVSLGSWHSGAITEDGSLYTWGDNDVGQLGNRTTEESSTPIKITIPQKASAYSANLPAGYSIQAKETEKLSKSYQGQPGEIYNFYALKSTNAENVLGADNLLYATQAAADENGKFTVSYTLKEAYSNPVIIVKAMSQADISGAEVTVPDILCNGEEQFAKPVVKLNGVTLLEDDYDIENQYSAIYPGIYEIVIVGTGNYMGKVKATYNIYCKHVFDNYDYETGRCTICKSLINTIGDFNDDYVTGIADVVILQKYLVKKESFIMGKPDINNDGKVNVFDLVMLKRIIMYS